MMIIKCIKITVNNLTATGINKGYAEFVKLLVFMKSAGK